MDESQRNITREELLRPLSRFQWVEDASAKGSSKKSKERASEARRSEGESVVMLLVLALGVGSLKTKKFVCLPKVL
jgi:hypothetical protein